MRVIIVVVLASCASGFIVKVDSDESFSANKYKDFEIFKPDPFNTNEDEEENPIRINRVAKALSDSLTELGLNEKENSPLKISFAVKERERFKQISSSHFFYGFRNDPPIDFMQIIIHQLIIYQLNFLIRNLIRLSGTQI